MPSRIIREGWLESEPINSLDPGAELFFLRLCLRADDYGCYHANPVLLKSLLFPLREATRSTDIPRWLAACEKAGLVRCYSDHATGKSCLVIPKFGQRVKPGTKRKFGEVPDFSRKIPENPGSYGKIPPQSDCGLRIAETKAVSVADPQLPKAAERPIEELIYEAYPRKVGRQDAIKAIRKCCMAASGDAILESTIAYARAVSQWPPGEEQFVPHPSTWFNRGSFTDDPQTWNRQQRGDNGHRPERIADADEAIRRHQQEMME